MAKPQDFAPVFTEWKLPSAEDVAGGISEEQRAAIVIAVYQCRIQEIAKGKELGGGSGGFRARTALGGRAFEEARQRARAGADQGRRIGRKGIARSNPERDGGVRAVGLRGIALTEISPMCSK